MAWQQNGAGQRAIIGVETMEIWEGVNGRWYAQATGTNGKALVTYTELQSESAAKDAMRRWLDWWAWGQGIQGH